MEYPKDFINLLASKKEECLIGWGNPNAKILVIGKESAIPKDDNIDGKRQYELEILQNHMLWDNNIRERTSQEDIVPFQFDESGDHIMNASNITYNPLYPYKGQEFAVRQKRKGIIIGKKGTSSTWYNYQKLCNLILDREVSPQVNDFFEYLFTTELSTAAAKYSHEVDKRARENSIRNRKEFLCHPFFQKFPIIILAAGSYPFVFDITPNNFWGPDVEYNEYPGCTKGIYKIAYTKGNDKKLFVQTYQLSMISKELVESIAGKCKSFIEANHIEL
jgi:hypothetical protein